MTAAALASDDTPDIECPYTDALLCALIPWGRCGTSTARGEADPADLARRMDTRHPLASAEALARASLDVETAFITASPAATTATNDPEDIEVIATNDLDATNEDPPSAAISPSASPSDEDVDRLVAQLTAINAQNDGRVALVIEHDEAHLTATVSIRTEILPALIVEAARESEPSALKDGLLIRRVKINGAWARALEERPTQNIHRAAFSRVATWLVVLGGCGPQSIL